MINIKLNDFFEIDIDVISSEDYLGSIETVTSITVQNLSSKKSVEFKSLYFEYSEWDIFLMKLRKGTAQIDAALPSMSEELVLRVKSAEEAIILSFEINEKVNAEILKMRYECVISLDQFAQVKEAFLGFEKWW